MPGSFSGPWTIPERARWQGATGRKATLRTPHALSSAPAPCHGAGASKHPFSKRCCLPESEALSRLDSGLWTLVHAPAVSGGMGLPVRASAHLAVCFEHPVHLFRASKRGVGGFSLSKEHGNMTAVSLALACAPSFGAALSDRKSTRLNSSHLVISYAVFCLKKKKEGKLGTVTELKGRLEALSL